MSHDDRFPRLLHTVLDTPDVRGLAEFYRRLLGLEYRTGDEPPGPDGPDTEWLVLVDAEDRRVLAFQYAEQVTPTTWPDPAVPMQLHLDITVPDRHELERHRLRALELGASLRSDRSDDPDEPLYVLTDPAGHPFCLFVGDS